MKKNDFEQYKRMLRFLAVIIMVCLVTFTFLKVWIEFYNEEIVFPFYSKGHWLISVVYAVLTAVFLYVYGGLKFGYLKPASIILSQVLAVLCTNVMIYMQISLLSAKLVNAIPILIMTIIDILVIVVWANLVSLVFIKLFPPRKLLLLYEDYPADSMTFKMQSRRDRYEIADMISVKMQWNELIEHVNLYDAILIYDVHSSLRNKLLKYCYSNSIRVYTTPKLSDIILGSAESIHLFDTPLLLCRNTGLTIEQRFAKRVMDIVIASVVLLLTWPFMILTAIAIKLYDGGPAFFTQERCTIDGKVFKIHKFRSMIVDAEKEGISVPASEKDPRITPIGNFIRKTRLDELPQVLDILSGNMSVVGPRPERVEHVEKYSKDIPEFDYRLKVKGGLTGYAQIYGKYNTTAYDKLKLDLMYIQNYSILLDIRLILMTIKVMFMKESTEGFDEKQISEIQASDTK